MIGISAFARKADGSLWGWGGNAGGELGDGTRTGRSSPVLVVGGHSFAQVAHGYGFTLARKTDVSGSAGTVWAWGYNNWGSLGNPASAFTSRSSPVLVVGAHAFVDIAAGRHGVARKADGSVWAWGVNTYGQLGDNSVTSRVSPVCVVGGHSFVGITAGNEFTLAWKADGSVWAWGSSSYGETGQTRHASSPMLVVGGHSFVEVSSGNSHVLARKADGSVWAWGINTYGELGNNSPVASFRSPVLVVGGHSFVEVSAGPDHSVARKADGSVWGWGRYLYHPEIGCSSSPTVVPGAHSFVEVNAGYDFTLGRKANGEVWAWGSNQQNALGHQDLYSNDHSSPVLVVGGHAFDTLKSFAGELRGAIFQPATGALAVTGGLLSTRTVHHTVDAHGATLSNFRRIRLSDGAVTSSVLSPDFPGGIGSLYLDDDPPRFGNPYGGLLVLTGIPPVVNAGADQGVRPTYSPTAPGVLNIDLHDGQGFRDWTRFLFEAGDFTKATANEPALFDFSVVNLE